MRYELKFLLYFPKYLEISKSLKPYLKPDSHGEEYQVFNLYYDTPDKRFFREKIDGEENRIKVRIRRYFVHGIHGNMYLEYKIRNNMTIRKQRFLLPPSLCVDKLQDIDSFIPHSLSSYSPLHPSILLYYTRQAYITKSIIPSRITFDYGLSYRQHHLKFTTLPSDRVALPKQYVIMEVKYTRIIPAWLKSLLRVHHLQTVSYSKYCECIKHLAGEHYGMVYK